MLLRFLIFTFVVTRLVGLNTGAYAQNGSVPASVTATITPDRGYVGDRFVYTITVEADSSMKFTGLPSGDKLGVFEIKSSSTESSVLKSGLARQVYLYEIAAYETGDFWIPAAELEVVLPDGGTVEIESDSLRVVIMTIAGRDSLADIRGLKEPIMFGRQISWLLIAIGVVLLIGIVYLLYRALRKKKIEEEPEKVVDTRPAWVIAQERLQRLRESDLVARGEFKLFYQGLTEIMRKYLEPRFGIDAVDRTTMELKKILRDARLDDDSYSLLFTMFDSADLVKFARRVPTRAELDADFQKAWLFVQNTSRVQTREVAPV